MSLSVNLMFDGNCREAATFYAGVFGQDTPRFVTYGESGPSFDPNVKISEKGKSLILNATLDINGTTLLMNDMPDNFEFIRGNSFGIVLSYNDPDEAKTIFEKLGKNGQVFVPFTAIPGQGYYGMLGDQFEICWTIKS